MEKQRGEEGVDLIPMALTVNSSVNTAVVVFLQLQGSERVSRFAQDISVISVALMQPQRCGVPG